MNRPILLSAALALALTACATDSRYDRGYDSPTRYSSNDRNERCSSCGYVDRIVLIQRSRDDTSGAGAVAGAIIGGVLGNQVGSGDGRKAATVVGAIAGGVAGNNIERNRRDDEVFNVFVRMDDGRQRVLQQDDLRGIREGSRVVVDGGNVRLI